jgi:hypothetical protein
MSTTASTSASITTPGGREARLGGLAFGAGSVAALTAEVF